MTLSRGNATQEAWRLFEGAVELRHEGLPAYLSHIVEVACSWFDASGASLFLKSRRGAKFQLAAKYGSNSSIPANAAIRPGHGIAGTVLQTETPLLVHCPADHPALSHLAIDVRPNIGTSMIVPLRTAAMGVLGVLNISRGAEHPEPFSDADVQAASAIANHVALAVSNATLMDRIQNALLRERELSHQLQGILDSLQSVVAVIDPRGRVCNLNSQAKTFFGVTSRFREDWHSLTELAGPEFRRELQSGIKHALVGISTGHRIESGDGRVWSAVGHPLPDGGATLTIEEMTEFERATAEVGRSRRLAEIGQMTASIAHEIRNPLTGIKGAAQIVRDEPERAVEFAAIILNEVEKLGGLCNDFLEFAKPLSLRLKPARLAEVVRQVIDRISGEFAQRGVNLHLNLELSSELVGIDVARVEQVVWNLLRNALEASEPGTDVQVTCTGLSIQVQDSGCGISKEKADQLFTPFFSTKAKGTGLGLSTARKIVEAHGGSIHVETGTGAGACFVVDFAARKVA